MNKEEMKLADRLQVYLDPKVYHKLKRYVADKDITISKWLVDTINEL